MLDKWKHRLGLGDWVIELDDNCRPDDMVMENVAGCAEWTECNKCAKIQMLDEGYYGDRIVPFDWEKTLVHELLHLKTSLVSDNVEPMQARVMHQLIDDLARAFVAAQRDKVE